MAAVAQQLGARGLEAAEQVERRDRAPRAGALVAVERDQHRRAVVALGDPRRDDPDHARDASRRRRARTRARPAALAATWRLGLEEDPRLDVAALVVDGVELGRDGAGALDVAGQQQLEARVGAVQPAGGVDPRREPEADRAGVDPARVDARDLHQRLQPRLARRGERAQPLAHEPAVLADERHAVGDRRERDEVEVGVGVGRVHPGAVEQRAGEHVRDAGGAQLGARVAAERRVHDRRVRQPAVGARRVVVGDDDVEPGGARRGDLVDRGDRAVDGHEQVGAARGEPLDRRRGEAVAVVDPARQVPVDVGAERAQRADEHGGRADAVDVVVAVDGDAGAALDVPRIRAAPSRRPPNSSSGWRTSASRSSRARCGSAKPRRTRIWAVTCETCSAKREPLGGGVVVRGDSRRASAARA